MDVYKKVIVKLYEETGGNQSEAVDFIELVKKSGFYSSYEDVFRELNKRAWISETTKQDWVKITHWGVKEAKKAQSGVDSSQNAKREANLLLAETKEFTDLIEEFLKDLSKDQFDLIEKKIGEMNRVVAGLKTNF